MLFVESIIVRAARMFAGFDKTQQRFLATPKVDPHLTRLATGKRTFGDPVLDPVLVILWQKRDRFRLPCQPPSNEHKVSVGECDVRPTWPVSAGWPLTLPTWIVLRAPAVHGVSSNTIYRERILCRASDLQDCKIFSD